MTRAKGFISDDLLRKVVDECAEHGTPIRFIRFGEPFLHPRIIEYCSYVKSGGLLLHVTNNGIAITEEQIRAIVDLEVDSLVFSFQGATRSEYEIMRNTRQYDKLVHSIMTLVEVRGEREKPFIHISTTVLDDRQSDIEEFAEFWRHVVDSVGVGKTNLRMIRTHDMDRTMAREIEARKNRQSIKKTYVPCKEVLQKLSVDWDGKVTCCCGDYDQWLPVGDLNESSLSAIWNNSDALKTFQAALSSGLHRSLTLCSTCYQPYEEI